LPPPPDAPFKPFAPIQSIGAIVAQFYGMKWRDLTGDCRHAEFVRPRHIAIYLAITMTGSSLPAIGRIFGGRDHTTLLSARNKIAKLVENNPLVRGEIELLKDLIRKRIAEIGNDPRQYLYRRAKWSRQS
jgi:chromosomal replication initiator protein